MPVISNKRSKLFKTPEESEKPERVEVIGTLPPWIKGSFLRVGPGMFDLGNDFTFNHWLDGYALLQKFDITSDSVKFEKKYLQSDAYKRGVLARHPVVNEFATAAQRDPNKSLFSRIVSTLLPEFTDNNYSTLFHIGTDIFASCDTCFFRKVDGTTLESGEKCDGNKLFGLNGQSAHPMADSKGDIYNVGFNLLPTAKYSFVKVPGGTNSKDMLKKAKTVASFSSRWTGALAINHSFGMTENYLIYVEQPVTVSVGRLASSLVKGETLKDVLDWRPQEKNRFVIVDKASGKVWKTDFLSSDSFYFMHIINSYEEGQQIIIDLVTYESVNMLDSLFLDNLRGSDTLGNVDLSCIQRFAIPLVSDIKSVAEGVELLSTPTEPLKCSAIRRGNKIILSGCSITEGGIEMPIFNSQYVRKPYRYVYAAGTFNESRYCHSITKTDLKTGETIVWKDGECFYPGEPYFVANPEGEDEDDGILIAGLTDCRENHDDILIFLDAKTLDELGRATFKSHVPPALHGLFLPK